jgi:FKBP-type peptidyl-prolyl cis-trans isomerase
MASTTVLHDGAVIKTVLKEGHGLEVPSDGARVVVHYTGKLEDGTVFDSSRARGQPFEVRRVEGGILGHAAAAHLVVT